MGGKRRKGWEIDWNDEEGMKNRRKMERKEIGKGGTGERVRMGWEEKNRKKRKENGMRRRVEE